MLGHVLAEAARPHIGPHLVDMGGAFVLGAYGAVGVPAGGDLHVGGPEGILLLVVDEDLVGVVLVHCKPYPFVVACGFSAASGIAGKWRMVGLRVTNTVRRRVAAAHISTAPAPGRSSISAPPTAGPATAAVPRATLMTLARRPRRSSGVSRSW